MIVGEPGAAGSTIAISTRRKTPFRTGSKRTSLIASVPTTANSPVAGFTPMAMFMFIRPSEYESARLLASRMATSWSSRVQPTGRPESAASAPETFAVQSAPVSSRHAPAPSRRTIIPTAGAAGSEGFRGGSKTAPEFGGGLDPPWGPSPSFTTFGGKARLATVPPPRIVVPLPDSNTATYTSSPEGLLARARGSSPRMSTGIGATLRSEGS